MKTHFTNSTLFCGATFKTAAQIIGGPVADLYQLLRQDQNIEYLAFELEWQAKKDGCKRCYGVFGLYNFHQSQNLRVWPLIWLFYQRGLGFFGPGISPGRGILV